MSLEQILAQIEPASEEIRAQARCRQNDMAKPLGSLGLLEDAIDAIAAAQHTVKVRIDKRAVVVFCADNGVVAQGVTQCGQEVTAIVTENLAKGDTTVCIMSRAADVEVIPVDIGVARDVTGAKILQKKVAYGTRDMTKGAAMTREQGIKAIQTGIDIACECKEKGFQLLATGEMGIGNTTTSAAVAAVLLHAPAEEMTGRGAGLSSAGLQCKINAIKNAIALNTPDCTDPIDVICKVGGFDIAGMVGLYLGGALCHIPVVMDGFISAVSALAAVRLCPAVRGYILPSHVSAEHAGQRILDALDAKPMITAGMRLGEGTGAVAAIKLMDLSLAVYHEMVSFEETSIAHYQPLS